MNTVEGFLGSAKGAMARRSGNATGLLQQYFTSALTSVANREKEFRRSISPSVLEAYAAVECDDRNSREEWKDLLSRAMHKAVDERVIL